MIDLVANKYSSLANEADREEYRKFVHFKQEVITKTNTLVGMLASTSSALQMIAQDFIFAVYELHQFLIQLVIDNTRPSKEKVLEIRAGKSLLFNKTDRLHSFWWSLFFRFFHFRFLLFPSLCFSFPEHKKKNPLFLLIFSFFLCPFTFFFRSPIFFSCRKLILFRT